MPTRPLEADPAALRRPNATHDPALRSWVASANAPGTDFPIQNLPFGVFRRRGAGESARVGVAIGDRILDLTAAAQQGAFDEEAPEAVEAASACDQPSLNTLMALGAGHWSALRLAISRVLRARARERVITGFGSCSFREPLDDAAALGIA